MIKMIQTTMAAAMKETGRIQSKTEEHEPEPDILPISIAREGSYSRELRNDGKIKVTLMRVLLIISLVRILTSAGSINRSKAHKELRESSTFVPFTVK